MQSIVKGKGQGPVILLHGSPGVGMTLTAESIVAMAGKCLFTIGPPDIGLDPAGVEQNLGLLFELAARWRAILLFDEADVFSSLVARTHPISLIRLLSPCFYEFQSTVVVF